MLYSYFTKNTLDYKDSDFAKKAMFERINSALNCRIPKIENVLI